jgi:hypothetical protein
MVGWWMEPPERMVAGKMPPLQSGVAVGVGRRAQALSQADLHAKLVMAAVLPAATSPGPCLPTPGCRPAYLRGLQHPQIVQPG